MQAIQTLDAGQLRGDGRGHDPQVFLARLRRNCEQMVETVRADGVSRNDAVDSMLAARDVEQVLAEVMRDVFGPRYSERYIPIGGFGVAPWARRYIQKRITRRGLIDYVTSADMPWINVDMQEITRAIRSLGAQWGWSWFEMQEAQFAGTTLDTELAMATREGAEDTKDLILLQGDAGLPKGLGFIPTGLINDLDIPIVAPGTGGWATATADAIIADISGFFVTARTQSRRAEDFDTLLIPEVQFGRLETLQVPNTSVSVRTWILANIAELTSIEVLPILAGAGVGAVDRAILYARTDRVLRGVVPLDFSFIAEEMARLRLDVWGVMRLVGLEIRRPFGMLYADGV